MSKKKVALITGASQGIGKVLAQGLAEDGWGLALVARNERKLKALVDELNPLHTDTIAQYFAGDVSNASFANQVVKELKSIDLLVNNAAIHHQGTLELSHEEFDQLMQINVSGVFNFLKAAISKIKKSKSGYIINISSIAGKVGFAGSGGYCTSKFAVNGLSESIFNELVPEGVKVTSICPSWVNTDMASHSGIPGEDMIQTSDILKTVRYLLSLSPNAVPKEVVISCSGFI